MTSRRKQIRPSKAHADTTIRPNSLQISELVNVKLEDVIHSAKNSIVSKEDSMEISILKIEMESESNEKGNGFEELKVTEVEHSAVSLDDISENLTKKMHKDDAKIIPFETTGGIDFFQCPLCDESSICGRENLTSHLQEHQNKTKRDDGKHLCCLCSKELSSNSSLERHLLTHSNHRPFSCTLCDKKFTTNGNLSRHIKTSHNNNGTIESSIDEVLKKHQLETYPVISDNYGIKLKKTHKNVKKESLNIEELGMNQSEMNMNFMGSSLRYMDPSKLNCAAYQPIISGSNSNLNLLSPFYSFNMNDFGFIQTKVSENCNFLNKNNLTIITNTTNDDLLKAHGQVNTLKIKPFNSILPKRLLSARRYRRKINCHTRNIRRLKRLRFSTNSIQCVKCDRNFLISTNILPHIRFCYKTDKKTHLFCPFTLCTTKFSSLKNLSKHIKRIHLNTCYPSIEPVSPPMEPLNLSIKKSSNYSLEQSSITKSSTSNLNLYKQEESLLQLSGSGSLAMIPNSSDVSIHFPPFQSINQFISTPAIVTLSPFQFSTPLTFSTPSFLGKPTSVPVIVNNGSLKINDQATWNGKTEKCVSLDSFSKSLNDEESCTSNSISNPLSSKYITGIKKKNSYKDAPKLITCPMDGCVQKFPWNSSLMRHILTHTAHKPFKCTRCIKSFSTKSNRERHMTRVHRVRINRSKFKSLQASRALVEDSAKHIEDGVDSENGTDLISMQDSEMRIIELSEEEWIIMDDSDRRAEDISSNLLKLAGQPIVEPNPVRLYNVERKIEASKYENTAKKISSLPNETFLYLDNCT